MKKKEQKILKNLCNSDGRREGNKTGFYTTTKNTLKEKERRRRRRNENVVSIRKREQRGHLNLTSYTLDERDLVFNYVS